MRTWRFLTAAVTVASTLAACGGDPPAPAGAPPPAAEAGEATPVRTPSPTSGTVPLVLAVHPSRPGGNVSLAVAERLIAGEVDAWSELGGAARGEQGRPRVVAGPDTPAPEELRVDTDAGALAELDTRDGTVAVVPATAVGPAARALQVDGRDPLREPDRYPLRMPGGGGDPRVVTMSIVGDIMLGRSVGETVAAGNDDTAPFRPTAERLAGADLTIGTFEAALSRLGPPTQDDAFSADPDALAGLELAGFDLLSLANNHVGDFGDRSLLQTLRRLESEGFATVGAGADATAAREPVVLEADGVRIGVLAFNSIGETPRAGRNSPGAVTLAMQPRLGDLDRADLAAMTSGISDLAERTDAVLVLPHWGEQYTPEEGRDQRRVARQLVGAGADLVVASHPHVVQGAAVHPGVQGPGFVAYSLGNFVFDMEFSVPTQQGVILELTLWGGQVKAARFVPVRIGEDFTPRVLGQGSEQSAEILGRIWANGGEEFTPPDR